MYIFHVRSPRKVKLIFILKKKRKLKAKEDAQKKCNGLIWHCMCVPTIRLVTKVRAANEHLHQQKTE